MKYLFKIIFLFVAFLAYAQSENQNIKKGNDYYRQSQFALAEAQYRQALNSNPQNTKAAFNLANALMQQKKWDEAQKIYSQLSAGADAQLKGPAYYNSGVAHTKNKELEESIEAYKNALRVNQDDKEARENLQKALSELKKKQGGGGSQNNKSDMSNSEAEKKLQQLQQKEKEAQQRLRKQKGESGGGAKDW